MSGKAPGTSAPRQHAIWIVDVETRKAERLAVTGSVTGPDGQLESAPAWSPDGTELAFYANLNGEPMCWIWNRNTRTIRRLASLRVIGSGVHTAPIWTKDGRAVIVHLHPESDTPEHAPETPEAAAAVSATVRVFRFTEETEKSKAVLASEPFDTSDAAIDTTRRGLPRADILAIDAHTGQVTPLARNISTWRMALSPDGESLLMVEELGQFKGVTADRSMSWAVRLTVVRVKDGERRSLFTFPMNPGHPASWSPDGRLVAFIRGSGSYSGRTEGCGIYVVSTQGGEPRLLTTGALPEFSHDMAPVWVNGGKELLAVGEGKIWRVSTQTPAAPVKLDIGLYVREILVRAQRGSPWSEDDHSVLVSGANLKTGANGIYRVDLATGKSTTVIEQDASLGTLPTFNHQSFIVSEDGSAVVFVRESATRPADYWIAGRRFAIARQLTRLNPALEELGLLPPRVIHYRSLRGEPLTAILHLPPTFHADLPCPLIVWQYPGNLDRMRQMHRFSLGLTMGAGGGGGQVLLSRGYALLLVSPPQHEGTTMRDVADGILPAVNLLIDQGIADPERLGVMGHSYGGFGTLALIAQTNRFKAAVAAAGIADYLLWYGYFGDATEKGWDVTNSIENQQPLLGGATPWQNPQRYVDNSPYRFFDRVTTPLLLTGGTEDAGLIEQSGAAFVALRRLRRTVEFRKYEGEGHGLRSYENQVDFWRALVRWFDKYMGSRTVTSDSTASSRKRGVH